MALINLGRVEVLVVVRLQAKQSLVLGKLVPGTAAGGLLEGMIEGIGAVGDPSLQLPIGTTRATR